MKKKSPAIAETANSKLAGQIAAAQKVADSAKKAAKSAKATYKEAKKKLKEARRVAKRARKAVKELKAEFAATTMRKPAPRKRAASSSFVVAKPVAAPSSPPVEEPAVDVRADEALANVQSESPREL